MYENIYGNCEKKGFSFQKVVENNFGHKRMCELITMIKEEAVNSINAKEIMKRIVDGETKMPSEIAKESGFVGEVVTSDEVKKAVANAIQENSDIVKKIKDGNRGPLMSLVGKVMRATNRRADPVVVKYLLEQELGDEQEEPAIE